MVTAVYIKIIISMISLGYIWELFFTLITNDFVYPQH